MDFRQVLDFNTDILSSIEDRLRRSYGKKCQKDEHTEMETKPGPNVHIVGQLADDIVLLTWDGKNEKCEKEITFFASFNVSTKELDVLFDYDRKVDVVTASVNEEQTLLAFTVVEFKPLFDNLKEETVGEIYKSFIAEISPKNRVFSLGIERPQYQRTHFLHGKYPLYGTSSRRESHMLFFHHSESIDLYHIPLARIDGGMVMSGQPQVEHLVKGFVWAQIDQRDKRLYYICPDKEITEEAEKQSQPTKGKLVFSALQFCERPPHVLTVTLPCPFPVNSNNIGDSRTRFQYDRRALMSVVTESNVNLQVVTSPKGSLFLCYQHAWTSRASQESPVSNDETDGSVDSEIEDSVIEYSVLMVHHGSILKCRIPNVVPERLVDSARLTFTMLNDCIAVILPGYIFHLLDCNAEHPPCHHLILQGLESIQFPGSGVPLEFVPINESAGTVVNKQELCFYEPSLSNIYKLKINNTYWTDCFFSTHRDSTRLALLHFSILHIQDPEISSQIFSHLVGDPANLECLDILKEYLIGSTSFQMKFQVEDLVHKLLPFSNAEPFRGHLETDRTGKKIARISYIPCNTQDIFARNTKWQDDKRRELDFWVALKRNASSSVKRFSLKNVAMSIDDPSTDSSSTMSNTGLTSLLKKFRKSPYVEPNTSGNGDSLCEYTPEFLHEIVKSDPEIKSKGERNTMKVQESLNRYLYHYLPSEIPKREIEKMASQYTRCQRKQSSYLLGMLWSGLQYTDETHPYHVPLDQRGTSRDRALLMLLERYHVAVKELCFPFPPGFHAFFTYMGFRCMEPRLFSQYVTNGVFEVDNAFMHRLLEDVGHDKSYAEIISRLFSSFEQSRAIQFLHEWDSPNVSRLLCQRYVGSLLSQESIPFQSDTRNFLQQSQRFDDYGQKFSSLMSSTEETSELQPVPFRPLVNVLTSLEATVQPGKKKRDGKGNGRNENSKPNFGLEFVSKHAMEHTASEVDNSLGLIAF